MDMCVALLAELKRIVKVNNVITILKIHPSCKTESLSFLFNTISDLSDLIYIKSDCALKNEAVEIFKRKNKKFILFRVSKDIVLKKEILEYSTFFRSHADVDDTSIRIGEVIKSYNNLVYAFLDGCYPPNNSIPTKYFNKHNAIYPDMFLLCSEKHKKSIESVGYKNKTVYVGYFKLYEGWRNKIKQYVKKHYVKREKEFTVSIFTRGEDDSLPKNKQLINNDDLVKVLNDIYFSLNELWGDVTILIKPHPSQNIGPIESTLSKNIRIVTEHPSILAELSDIVITNWSTSIVDAIISGVPCLEYFKPTKYFYDIYENGSSFKQLGIPSVKNKSELLKYLSLIKNNSYKCPNAKKVLEHRNLLHQIIPS